MAVFASARAAEPKIDVQAARAGKGVLVLQTGSDWCVSGEQVRKVFESSEFRRAVGSKYLFAVHDEMEEPTDAVKESNALVSEILIRTKRFPAITCYAPGTRLRVFAQVENVPGDISAEKLALHPEAGARPLGGVIGEDSSSTTQSLASNPQPCSLSVTLEV
jgi:hypothetical protein